MPILENLGFVMVKRAQWLVQMWAARAPCSHKFRVLPLWVPVLHPRSMSCWRTEQTPTASVPSKACRLILWEFGGLTFRLFAFAAFGELSFVPLVEMRQHRVVHRVWGSGLEAGKPGFESQSFLGGAPCPWISYLASFSKSQFPHP